VRTDQDQGIILLIDRGSLTLGPGAGIGGEISGYGQEGRFCSMREYAREVARQGQQGGRVATTAAPQPAQLQHVARFLLFQSASAQVTAFRAGIARHLWEIGWYYSCWSTGKASKEQGNEDRIEELSVEDEEQEEGKGDSSAEDEEESETEEERDARLDEGERNKYSAVVCTQAGYVFVDERRKKTDEVARGDDKGARIEEQFLVVSTSAGNQEKSTISKAVAFSKLPAKADLVEIMNPESSNASTVPQTKSPALATGNYKVLGSS